MENRTVFGIDLGTTNSCISYIDEASGRPAVVTNAEGDLTTPSVVLFDGDDRIVGREAKNAAVMYAERVAVLVKRQMGVAGWRFGFEGQGYSAEEISSYILRKLAADAEALLGTPVQDVVITCPAYFGITEREATAKAGEIAGLKVLEVINEPTAAAISYGAHVEENQTLLVYDLGGGTFDVTLIEIKDGSIRVVATDGDHALGGRDWDETVVNYLAEQWMQETVSADDPRESEETRQELWQRAEQLKQSLSARVESKVVVSHAGQRVSVTLTREKFEELTGGLLARTVQFTKRVLKTGEELGTSTFQKLLLVGGSIKMPQVASRLTEEFTVTPIVRDPDLSVAKGAAIYAQKLALNERIEYEIDILIEKWGEPLDEGDVPQEIVDKAIEKVAEQTGMVPADLERSHRTSVTNVASKSFGIVVVDDSDPGYRQYVDNLVLAQEGVPAVKTRKYLTVEPEQTKVDLQIMENTERERKVQFDHGRPIGHVVLKLTEGLPKGAPIEVTFDLTPDGRLKVTGRDLAESGVETTAELKTDRGLSKEEMEQAKSRSQGLKVG